MRKRYAGVRLAVFAVAGVLVAGAARGAVYVGHQTSASTRNATHHLLDVGELAIEAGDLLVAHLCVDGGGSTAITCPAGWSEVENRVEPGVVGAVCLKQASSADAAATSFEFTSSLAQQAQSGLIVFAGHDAADPVEASAWHPSQDRTPVSPALPTAPSFDSTVLRLACANAGQVTEGQGFPARTALDLWMLESFDGGSGPVSGAAALDDPGALGAAEWTGALATRQAAVSFTLALRAGAAVPVADAGPDLTLSDTDGDGVERFRLDGSRSRDPEGSLVSWTWSEAGTRLGSRETLKVWIPTGTHEITLTVENARGATASDTATITVSPMGAAPDANAGPDQHLVDSDGDGEEAATLDGRASSDEGGTILSWTWTKGGLVLGSGPVLAVALALGTHDVVLSVVDDEGNEATDLVTISVAAGRDRLPAAPLDFQTSQETSDTTHHVLDVDQLAIAPGDLLLAHLCVDGGRGVRIGCPEGFTEELHVDYEGGGVAGALCARRADDDDANATRFVATTSRAEQSQNGVLVLRGQDPVAPIEATAFRNDERDPSPESPGLPAPPDPASTVLRFLCADGGMRAEPEGFPSGMARDLWLLETRAGTSGPVTAGAAVDAVGAAGSAEWTGALTASMRSVNFSVAVLGTGGAPLADAGPDVQLDDAFEDGSEAVRLDGSGSDDPGGRLVAWTWSVGGAEVATGESVVAMFSVGTHSVTLTVEDDEGNTATDTLRVTVRPRDDVLPVADAGPDQSVVDFDDDGFDVVSLDASGSFDPDGQLVSWTWADGATPLGVGETLDVALPVGSRTLTLTVEDDAANTASDTLEVTVDPAPPVGACQAEVVAPRTLYHIGHSLTDRMADLLNQMLEAQSGRAVSYAYRSFGGATLYGHWRQTDRTAKGNVRGNALEVLRSGVFDTLVLAESTGIAHFLEDSQYDTRRHANLWVDEFLDHTTRPDPRVFVYSLWGGREVGAPDTPESIAAFLAEIDRQQPHWEELTRSIRDAHPGVPVHIVPGGLVLKRLQERVLDGSLTLPGGLTYRETFFKRNRPGRHGGCAVRDHIHPGEAGIYAIALTHHVVVHRTCPIGFPSSIPYPRYFDGCIERDRIEIDPLLALEIQRVVWEVVNDYPWTGMQGP